METLWLVYSSTPMYFHHSLSGFLPEELSILENILPSSLHHFPIISVFHAFTVLAFAFLFITPSITIYSLRPISTYYCNKGQFRSTSLAEQTLYILTPRLEASEHTALLRRTSADWEGHLVRLTDRKRSQRSAIWDYCLLLYWPFTLR
jgi:hypothetical protein